MTNPDNSVFYEWRDDGVLFHLEDGVKALVRWATATKHHVELWREEPMVLTAPEQGNLNTARFRAHLVGVAQDTFGVEAVPNIKSEIDRVAIALRTKAETSEDDPAGGNKTIGDALRELFGPSPMDLIIKYAKEEGEFFHTAEPEAFATVAVQGHRETLHMRGRAFKLWLRNLYYRREKQRREEAGESADGEGGAVFPERGIAEVVNHLETLALFEGVEREVFLRVAGVGGRIYVDLCDESWRVVEISPEGWEVMVGEDAPVRFIRSKGMLPLPEPRKAAGALEELRSLLNLGEGPTADRNWSLILAWLVWAFSPKGPYPILVFSGSHGSAKSMAQRFLRNTVDPNSVPLGSVPKDEHNLFIDATSQWVIAPDNLSGIPAWLSDALCKLATEGGFSTRTLYTDRDRELFNAMRPILLNGIGDVATRSDLLSRALLISLPPIPKSARKVEKELTTSFEMIRPGVLAAIFDAIAHGLATVEKVETPELPRMADFAKFSVAAETKVGGEPGSFLAALFSSEEEAVEAALESASITGVLLDLAKKHRGRESAWVGTPKQLFEELNTRASDEIRRARDWPKSPAKLGEQIKRLTTELLEIGVHVERPPRTGRAGRRLEVFFVEPPEQADTADTAGTNRDRSP